MAIPDRDEVVSILERNDRDVRCRRAIESAWSIVKTQYPSLSWFRRKTTGRSLMWEHSVEAVIDALADDRDIRAISHHDTVSFIMNDTVLMRLKKADGSLITSNYPTPLAGLFHRHERDLFGHEGHQRIELVHVLNPLQTDLVWIGVVARDDHKNVLWEHELRTGTGGATIHQLPIQPRPTPAADTVLRPVKPAAEKREEEE
jgi:hypothetical protein